MNLITAIKSIMAEEGLTQQAMAERMGVPGGASAISGRFARKNMRIQSVLNFMEALPEWELVIRRKDGTSERVITDVE